MKCDVQGNRRLDELILVTECQYNLAVHTIRKKAVYKYIHVVAY